MDDNKNSLDMHYVVFGPDLNANSDFIQVGSMIARRGTPQAEWLSKHKSQATSSRPAAHSTTSKSKLQAIKIEQEKPGMQKATDIQPRAQEVQPQLSQSRLSHIVSFFDQPGGRAFALVLSAVVISTAIVIYAILMRPPRYLPHSHNNIIFDTRTGKWSSLSDAPPIWPERRK